MRGALWELLYKPHVDRLPQRKRNMRGDEFPTDLLFLALDEQNFYGTDENGFTGVQAQGHDGCGQPSSYDSHSSNSSSKPASPQGEVSSGSGSPRVLGRSRRPVNPVPRHKRHSHISAEHRRRNKIQRGFAELQSLIPAVNDNPASRDSKSAKLFKTNSNPSFQPPV
ncbi:uncharacterized protein LOC135470757 isoform X2 [Liolophura sinensis]|uniref:uncharacterized protein LOC135470757 isoform X2 n=1 Tax=Liolophura sinensis TaxID=3198878 RepID=UPI0031592CCC